MGSRKSQPDLPEYPLLSSEDTERMVELAVRFVRSWRSNDSKERRNARAAFDRFRRRKAVDPVHALQLHLAFVAAAKRLEGLTV